MMIIQDAADYIYDEIGDAEKYIRAAIKLHETDEEFADCLYKLSGEELGHADRLHEQVTRLIRTYKDEKGVPPALMMQLYEREHARIIDRTAEVKRLQELYRK